MNLNRRDILTATVIAGTSMTLTGCETIIRVADRFGQVPRRVDKSLALADVHAHVFNASDLPGAAFIEQVFLKRYQEQVDISVSLQSNKSSVNAMLQLMLALFGANKAPTAKQELLLLKGDGVPEQRLANERRATNQIVNETLKFVRQGEVENKFAPTASGANRLIVKDLIREVAGQKSSENLAFSKLQKSEVSAALQSETLLGLYLRWISLFRQYRYVLVQNLKDTYDQQGLPAAMITPAMVDYEMWLGEQPVSDLDEQIEVMAAISARNPDVAVHVYAPFDPLREALWQDGKQEFSSLNLVKNAIEQKGAIGVKLYPPMGFRAWGTARETQFPSEQIKALGRSIGFKLDDAMINLFDYVRQREVPIIAHAANSNESIEGYGMRADPAYWVDAFNEIERRSGVGSTLPSVCLAHLGRFTDKSANPVGSVSPENSWEWTFGKYLADYRARTGSPEAPFYADLSYLAEILPSKKTDVNRLAKNLTLFVSTFDPECRHLIFGSDWIMLGREFNHRSYAGSMQAFLSDRCGFNPEQITNIMRENALRFWGMTSGGSNRARLLKWRRDQGLPDVGLPVLSD